MLQFLDSCSHYDIGFGQGTPDQVGQKYTSEQGAQSKPGSRGSRTGRQLELGTMSLTLPHRGGWVAGFAVNFEGSNISPGVMYSAKHVDVTLFIAKMELDGSVSLYAGDGSGGFSALIGNSGANSPPFSAQQNAWYYFEVKYSIGGGSNMAITGECRVNGQVVVASASANSGINVLSLLLQTATANNHTWNTTTANGNSFMCDFYIADQSGSGLLNSYAGDVAVSVSFPGSDVVTNWSATGSPAHSQVNEQFPDGDATYINSDTVAQVESFGITAFPAFTGTIPGIQVLVYARKDDEGTRAFTIDAGGDHSGNQYVGDTYLYYRLPLDQQHGGAAWTLAALNALDIGVTLTV